MASEHAPLPWKAHGFSDLFGWRISHGENLGVAMNLTQANAEFIVRAVNSHAALLGSLGKVLDCYITTLHKEGCGRMIEELDEIVAARAAIAQAEAK